MGRQRLDQVKPFDLQELYTEMQKRGISARTVRYTHSVLSSAFKQAVRWQKLAHDPTVSVDLPRRVRREMRALTVEEVKRFQDAASNDPRGNIFIFLIATGARPSEALALRWSDTDLERGIVTIRRTLVRLKGSWHFAEPKTAKSRRAIPLPGGMVRTLKDHRRLQAKQRLRRDPKHEDHDLVFATATGAPLDLHNLTNRNFKPILHAAGLPRAIRIYDLRHTTATCLLAAGENPKVVSERLGHSGVGLLLDTYAHVLPTMQQQAADRLDALLFNGK